MIRALYEEDAYGQPMSDEKIQRTVRELRARPQKGQITIFEVSQIIVGYAIVIYHWSNEYGGDIACIDEIYVKPAWRGRGIGTAFLDDTASSQGGLLRGLQLEVTPKNDRVMAYYLRRGFTPCANRCLVRGLKEDDFSQHDQIV